MFQRPDDNIRPDSEGFLALRLGVAVDFGIVPTIARIGLIGIEYAEAAVIEQTEALGGFAIVIVSFRHAVREIEMAMIKAIGERQFHQILFGEDSFQLRTDGGIEAVIVINIEKPSGVAIGPQALDFSFSKIDAAVTGHKNKGIIENIVARHINPRIFRIYVDIRIFCKEPQHVRFLGLAVVPIASTRIFQARNDKFGTRPVNGRGKFLSVGRGWRGKDQQ